MVPHYKTERKRAELSTIETLMRSCLSVRSTVESPVGSSLFWVSLIRPSVFIAPYHYLCATPPPADSPTSGRKGNVKRSLKQYGYYECN